MTKKPNEMRVKVADYAVGRSEHTLVTIGLGSCVAITLYDRQAKIGGLAHILLPSPSMSRETSNPAKFPETIVPIMIAEMQKLGSSPRALIVGKIVGGASMFGQLTGGGGVNIGDRNIASTRLTLAALEIPIVADDTGQDYGRSVYFHLDDGRVEVRSLKKGDRVI